MQARHSHLQHPLPLPQAGRLFAGILVILLGGATMVLGATNLPKSTIMRVTPGGFSPVPFITGMTNHGDTIDVSWFGLTPPFRLEKTTNLNNIAWTPATPGTNGTTATIPNDGLVAFLRVNATAPYYVGAPVCMGCHPSTHDLWSDTRHAHAFETLKNIGRHKTGSCLTCHTVGYGLPNGFVNEETTPWLKGVQCENCHGPGGNHVGDPYNLDMQPKLEMSSMVCGGCHSGAHHNTYVEWEMSRHGHALSTLQNRSFAPASCLECHSQDTRFAMENGITPPTVQEAQLSIECSTCHSAHGPNVEVAQLKMPIGMLCGDCHTAGDPRLGSSPHHPQYQVLSGWGTFNEDGTILTNTFSTHTTLGLDGGLACARCHVIQVPAVNPSEGNPNITGHTFNPFNEEIPSFSETNQYAGCLPCHSHNDADFLRNNKQTNVGAYLSWLSGFFSPSSPSYIDPAGLSATDSNRLAVAKWNFQFLDADASVGIHNPNFYRASLFVASNIVTDLGTMPLPTGGGGQ